MSMADDTVHEGESTRVDGTESLPSAVPERAPEAAPRSFPDEGSTARVGQTIKGTYRLVRILGRGGHGTVYEAEHTRLPKRFAVKLVASPDIVGGDEAYERFKREAELMSELDHPNIVSVVDFDLGADGSPYMVMELLRGQNLAKLARAMPPDLDREELVELLGEMLDGLAAAHAAGVVHRDVKPSNVFIVENASGGRTAKVLDFGISKLSDATKITADGAFLGTPRYVAPEQARGRRVDHRADLFSAGIVIYQALVGRHPFGNDSIADTLYRTVHGSPAPIDDPELDQRYGSFFRTALAKRPERRFQTAESMATALRAALRGEPARGVPRRALWIGAAAAMALASVVGVAVALSGDESDPPAPLARPAAPRAEAPPREAPASSPSTAPVQRLVRVELEVDPANATLRLDGEPLDVPSFELSADDDERHRLVVTAPDHDPYELDFVGVVPAFLEGPVAISLDRRPEPPREGARRSRRSSRMGSLSDHLDRKWGP